MKPTRINLKYGVLGKRFVPQKILEIEKDIHKSLEEQAEFLPYIPQNKISINSGLTKYFTGIQRQLK